MRYAVEIVTNLVLYKNLVTVHNGVVSLTKTMKLLIPGALVKHKHSGALGIIAERDKYANLIVTWLNKKKHFDWVQKKHWNHYTIDNVPLRPQQMWSSFSKKMIFSASSAYFCCPLPKDLQVLTDDGELTS